MKRFFIRLTGIQLLLLRVAIPVLIFLLFILWVQYQTTKKPDDFGNFFIVGFLRSAGLYVLLRGAFHWLWWHHINNYLRSLLPEKEITGLRRSQLIEALSLLTVLLFGLLLFTGLILLVLVYPWIFFVFFGAVAIILIYSVTRGKENSLFPYKAVKAIRENKPYDSVFLNWPVITVYSFDRLKRLKQLQDDIRSIYLQHGLK